MSRSIVESCERLSMNQRVASTPMRSISSVSVTKSPAAPLDIFVRSPPSTTCTNCRIGTSTRSGSSPSVLAIAFSRAT